MHFSSRRQWLAWAGAAWIAGSNGLPAFASPMARRALQFPRDHGSHNDAQTEWWYLTGHAKTGRGQLFGFQLTFFRSRVPLSTASNGRLAPRQLLFSHAALTDVAASRQWHDQRIARWNGITTRPPEAPRYAQASTEDMAVHIGADAFLRRETDGTCTAHISTRDFALRLRCMPTQALLLQGTEGFSRKGPSDENASYYVTHPQLNVQGQLRSNGEEMDIEQGKAWLDHEWSASLLPTEAVGWDWIGINLHNGAALTAFRLRRTDGSTVWAGGSWRANGSSTATSFAATEVNWTPLSHWRSDRTQASYPVRWRVDTPAGTFVVKALVNDQELDSRQSTGTVYWEGLSALYDSSGAGEPLGMGYLEMTGYAGRVRL
ncbi:lipocalin-like domain-containing protein [Hydrogenophaga sp. 5NK40-0174]|uniref:lipocalin-like domain-containing protein n=1 Tax=Hydrogenophaga sp. 5NK40-0174 TaxID=3127649 RepID=UPI00310627F6